MTQDIKILEQGPGQWPAYLVSEDWSEAWTITEVSDRIHTGGRPGKANYIWGRPGTPVEVDSIPDDAVIQEIS